MKIVSLYDTLFTTNRNSSKLGSDRAYVGFTQQSSGQYYCPFRDTNHATIHGRMRRRYDVSNPCRERMDSEVGALSCSYSCI